MFLKSLYIFGVSIVLQPSSIFQWSYSMDFLSWQVQYPLLRIFSCTLHHMMIFLLSFCLPWFGSVLEYLLKQDLPTTWLPVWWIICAEVILLHFLYLFSTTDQYLVFSWFYHVHYSDCFYETKDSKRRFASTNRKLNGKFDCVIGGRSFSLRGQNSLEWIDSIEDADSMKVDGANPLLFSFNIFHGHSIT